jgi:RHS repeat-associated protein
MEKDDAGTVRASYVHSQRLDEIVQMNRNNVDYYYSQDGLGSVTEVTDSSGRVLETYSYDAYGIPSATSSLGNPYLFTGQEFDDETGLYFLRARYYDPRLGRFLTSDPLGVLFETNLYSYVSNNPISNVDPLGFASTFTGLAPPTDGRWVLRGVLYPDLLSIDQEKRRLLGEFVDDVFWGDFIDLYQPGVDIWDYVKFVLTLDNKSQNLLDTLRYFDELKEAGPLGIWEEVDPSVAVPCAGVGCPNTAGVGGEDPAVPDCTIPGACTCDELDPMLCAADPTFIQMPVSELAGFSISTKSVGGADPAPPLIARIDVPIEGALVRADVPVFGVAYGEQFEEYRVQIGQGSNPTNWTEIASANSPQETSVEAGDLDDSFNTSIQGNLATWDTGLTNYVYLPSHPAGHPIDLRGTYTIRLVATGRDGTEAEDRATLTVANVIPNAWGGVATSPDERLRLVVPEQALRDVFRLVSFETVDDVPVGPPVGANLVGPVYRAREVGEQFTKPVTLEVSPPKAQLGSVAPHRLGLYGYDEEADVWVYLPSTRSEKPDVTLKASVTTLHAFYTVMASDAPDEGSRLAPARPPGAPVTSGESFGHFLIQDTFEETTGAWSSRDGDAGASVSLDRTASFDDTGALKIVNVNAGGTQAVTVIDAPFDARRHPIVQFDYRIPSDVRTNLFAKVAGRWYEVAFTDGEKHLVNQRVNIASIGRIDGVIADDGWHTAQFNLYEMLRTKTGNVVVEEMVMADWNVLGYMKLAFGSNEKDATYYIDNFSIARDVNAGLPIGDEILLVDDFNKKKDANLLRGPVTTFTDGSLETIRVSFAADVTGVVGNTLSLVADFRDQGTFGGYISSLTDLDLRGFQALTFRMQGTGTEGMLVGLKDDDDYESKLPVDDFAGSADADGWRQVEVPLVAFGSELRLSRMDNLSLSFEAVEHDSLTVQVDDLAFGRTLEAALVDDFEHDSATNRLSGGRGTRTDGPGAVGTGYVSDESGRALRVSYGGSIGEALDGVAGLGYATWYTSLGGIDCTACAVLSFRIRGEAGGETPNVYLADGNFRWGVNVEDYAPVTTSWQSVSIPIADVAGYGVDLTHLAEVEFAFEWEEMSGTVYLDDIRLGPAVPTPIAGADSPDPVP